MTTITVTQECGPLRVEVVRSVRVSPHVQRVTFAGADLDRLHWRGFDQWVRLFLPSDDPASLDHVPQRLTRGTYVKMRALPARRRPSVRSYTLRSWRPEVRELDVDFVVHGESGVAGPWSVSARPGDRAVMLDQGCGWTAPDAGWILLVADETGMPAVLGILRDLPRTVRGVALIEVPDLADAQQVDHPEGISVEWLVRGADQPPGRPVLAELALRDLPAADRHAFAVGESGLATGVRRHLVRDRGWGRGDVTFCGYWKR
ncbi:siderophore-interacting protein [Nigerium massiliense]|uniref:siderophore-interacting protein n=1 Tax=Nigerium massiliense TaxID=1522317 RepID=UPI00069352D6|nr:siderophore-interacting protein [Nigerium massiliense]